MTKKRILVANDDGIHSTGINALAAALEPDYDVWVVAPDREQSAKSHALTLDRPLRLIPHGPQRFAVDGTPADCIYLAITHVLKWEVDLVVSGINHGANLGDDVAYSGTVSAAREAAFMGKPAIAFSLVGRDPWHFEDAAKVAAAVVHDALERGMQTRGFLNVNIPNLPHAQLRGAKPTRLGRRRYDYAVEEKLDPRGRHYYWIGGNETAFQQLEGSDWDAVHAGYVSVTPLFTDLTDYQSLGTLQWVEGLPVLPSPDR